MGTTSGVSEFGINSSLLPLLTSYCPVESSDIEVVRLFLLGFRDLRRFIGGCCCKASKFARIYRCAFK